MVASGSFYILAYTWLPQFCYQQRYPGCLEPYFSEWNEQFVLHGLWIQDFSSNYSIINCGQQQQSSLKKFDESILEYIPLDDLLLYWPNVKKDRDDVDYGSFWEHEWNKHG